MGRNRARIRARTVSRVLEDPASLFSYCGYTGRLLGFFLPSFLERTDLSRVVPLMVSRFPIRSPGDEHTGLECMRTRTTRARSKSPTTPSPAKRRPDE